MFIAMYDEEDNIITTFENQKDWMLEKTES